MLYLDYAASTPIRRKALDILTKSMEEDFSNPSSAHFAGRALHKRIESCRDSFLAFMDAEAHFQFIFTGSATESNNMIIKGIPLKPGDTALVSFADHPSVTQPVLRLKNQGINVEEIRLLPNGLPDEESFRDKPDSTTKLVVLSHVNNQTGTITDVLRLAEEIKKINKNIHIHVDGAQGFGKIPLSLRNTKIDSMAISSHKIGGPKGIAGLYLRNKVNILPLLDGGEQENGMRSSTQAAPLIFSFCEAARESFDTIKPSLDHVADLSQLTFHTLSEKINTLRFPFMEYASPYIFTFILPGISSDIILRHLEQQGILISSTSACSSRIKGINPVFTALHIPEKYHKCVLRASFSHDTSTSDIETFCNTLESIYHNVRMYIK